MDEPAGHDDAAEQFWFNPATRQVERGRQSPWTTRMGPYPTREAAERALDLAQGRSAEWDEADRAWRGED